MDIQPHAEQPEDQHGAAEASLAEAAAAAAQGVAPEAAAGEGAMLAQAATESYATPGAVEVIARTVGATLLGGLHNIKTEIVGAYQGVKVLAGYVGTLASFSSPDYVGDRTDVMVTRYIERYLTPSSQGSK
jgi:hypothetical protein